MTSYFITGDRALDPVISFAEVLRALSVIELEQDDEIFTGIFETGVERAVRYLFPDAQLIMHDTDSVTGRPDLTARDAALGKTVDKVVFIHPDPLASRLGKSLVEHVPADQLTFL